MKKEDLLDKKETATVLTDETFGKFTEGTAYVYNKFLFHVDGKVKREAASPLYEISLLDTSDEANEVKSYSLPIGDIKKKVGCTYKKVYASQSTGKVVVLSEEDIQKAVETKYLHLESAFDKVLSLLREFVDNDVVSEFEASFQEISDEFEDKATLYYEQKAIEAKTKKEEAEKKQAAKKIDMSKLTAEQLAAILAIVNGNN